MNLKLYAATTALSFVVLTLACAPARAEDFTLENLEYAGATSKVRIPRLSVSDSPMTRAEGEALAKSGDAKAFAAALSKVSAGRMVLPELIVETKIDKFSQTAVYRDVVFEKVAQGRAQSMTIAGVNAKGEQDGDALTTSIGPIGARGADFALLARVAFSGRDAQKDRDFAKAPLADETTFADFKWKSDKGPWMSIGSGKILGSTARPLLTPAADIVDLQGKNSPEKQTPERRKALFLAAFDMLDSFDIASAEARNISGGDTALGADGKGEYGFDGLEIKGFSGAKIKSVVYSGVTSSKMSKDEKIQSIALEGLDFTPLAAAKDDTLAIPHFDMAAISGFNVNGVSLARAELKASDWLAVTPKTLSFRLEKMTGKPTDIGLPILSVLGFAKVTIDGEGKLVYSPEQKTMKLEALRVSSPELGKADLALTFTNVAPELFGPTLEGAKAAGVAVQFSDGKLDLEDSGLLNKLGDKSRSGISRAELGQAAEGISKPVLGENPKAAEIAKTFATFFAKGRKLNVNVEAPGKIGLLDLMMMSSIGGLTERLSIKATQE